MTTISTTELTLGLTDVLRRVRERGEYFEIEQEGQPVAMLTPVGAKSHFTGNDLVRLLKRLPSPDEAFADDLEAIHAA